MKSLIAFSLVTLLLTSCKKDDSSPAIEMLVNGNMESGLNATSLPTNWFVGHPNPNATTRWTDSVYHSATHSFSIYCVKADTDFFAVGQSYHNAVMPSGKDLTLNVKIKGNLQGRGVSIVVRADSPTVAALQFVTSQYSTPITGTFDWTNYSLKLTYLDPTVSYVIVYLVYQPGTTGKAYFDDVSLTHP